MASNNAIQFYGSTTVLKAFEASGLTVWAVFWQKDKTYWGDTAESLKECLDTLGAGPVYKLKMYKNVDDADDIDEKTPCNGSFNFKLEGEAGGAYSKEGTSVTSRLLRRLDDIEANVLLKRLDSIEEKMGKASGEGIDVIGAVNNLINDPASLVQVLGVIKGFFQGGAVHAMGMSSNRPPGNTEQQTQFAMNDEPLESKIERMQNAINILEQNDPQLVPHLEKLAKLSQINRPLFEMMLSSLDNMVK